MEGDKRVLVHLLLVLHYPLSGPLVRIMDLVPWLTRDHCCTVRIMLMGLLAAGIWLMVLDVLAGVLSFGTISNFAILMSLLTAS